MNVLTGVAAVELTLFDLFCWYYLGLNPEGEVRFANANHIARRLNWTPQDVIDYLGKHGLHPDRVLNTDFPLSRYQVDLQIAAAEERPETLRQRAEMIYEHFQAVVGQKPRDWHREIAEEREADRQQRLNQRFSS